MTFTDDLVYGVLITQIGGGKPFMAFASDGRHRAIFRTRREAVAFTTRVPQRKMKVVKVKAEYTIL